MRQREAGYRDGSGNGDDARWRGGVTLPCIPAPLLDVTLQINQRRPGSAHAGWLSGSLDQSDAPVTAHSCPLRTGRNTCPYSDTSTHARYTRVSGTWQAATGAAPLRYPSRQGTSSIRRLFLTPGACRQIPNQAVYSASSHHDPAGISAVEISARQILCSPSLKTV